MKKMVLLVVMSGMLLGTSCPASSPLICSNNLDGSAYGFTMTVPQEFTCGSAMWISSPIKGAVQYRDSTNNRTLAVLVLQHADSAGATDTAGVTYVDLADYATGNGITFGVRKGTSTTGTVSYTAAVEITTGGDVLGVQILAAADSDAVRDKLYEIIETVVFTGS
jgi:hypothetical protein